MVQRIIENKRPYQREKYIAFKQSGAKLSSRVRDGFQEYRDISTGESVGAPDGANLPTIRQFTFDRRTETILSYAKDRDAYAHGENVKTREFVYFIVRQISARGIETIGRITEYTTEERLSSMIYRHYNREHASPCAWKGKVLYSGSSTDGSRMPYVEIPDSLIDESGLTVDDEVLITVTNERGDSHSEHYHISNMGLYVTTEDLSNVRRYIIPLVGFKRAVVIEPTGEEIPIHQPIRFVTSSTYRHHSALLSKGEPITYKFHYKGRPSKLEPKPPMKEVDLPCHRFIEEYSEVTVQLTPEPYTINNLRVWGTSSYRPVELSVDQIRNPSQGIKIGTWFVEPIKTTPGSLLNPSEDDPVKPKDIQIGRFDFVIETLLAFRLPPRVV